MLDFSMMGKRIKQRRKELNITQNQFAEMLQISNNHLSTIENGRGIQAWSYSVKFVLP